MAEDLCQVRIVNIVGAGKTDGSDAGIVGEIEGLQQGEDGEVVEPVVLLVERVEVIFRHGHGHLSPVPLGHLVLP